MTFEHQPGLGIVSADMCVWAGRLRPADEPLLMVKNRASVTIKEKPHIMEPVGDYDYWVCGMNRWIQDHPILAWGALAAGFLLLRRGK